MNSERSAASVVMVVRNEPVERIERALELVAAQVGVGRLVVVIAAPGPERAGLTKLQPAGAIAEIRLVDNPTGGRSSGLNHAIRAAPHEVVVRVDARSALPAGYVAACIRRLETDPVVGIVGGVQWPEVVEGVPGAAGIVRALRNPWLLGNAAYRRRDVHGPTDTVYLGAFRRTEVLALGGYDESLHANVDYELAQRYRDLGFQVWLEEDMPVGYEPRAELTSLARQYHAFGVAKVRFWRRTGNGPNARQWTALTTAVVGMGLGAAALRKPTRAAVLLALGIGAVAALDHLAEPTERDVRVRARACTANIVIAGSWFWGIASGLVRGTRRSGDREHPLERDTRPLGRGIVDHDLVDDFAAPE